MAAMDAARDTLAIISVNYRSAPDTLECIQSVLETGEMPWMVVVDNDSGDGSVETMADWAAKQPRLKDDYEVRNGGAEPSALTKRLTIVRNPVNGGFSSGNNAGLRLAERTEGVELFWLLNNDTTVEPDAVDAVLAYFRDHPETGMAGTQLRLYHDQDWFQLLNGMRFSKWTGAAGGIGAGERVTRDFDPAQVAAQTDFVCGASLIMTRNFFDAVGYLEERFFLYYEEIDLAFRGRKFPIGFVDKAVVYHKEGASAGSASQLSARARSPLSEYHHIRSKMIFARKHLPWVVPIYGLQNIVILMRRLLRRQPPQARAIWRAMTGKPLNG